MISIENFQSFQIAIAGDAINMLRFIYTRNLDLAILLSNPISIEILPSFQITTAGDSDNM
jgi:hypothetical protein